MGKWSRLVSLLCAVAMVCAIVQMAPQLAIAGSTASVKIAVASPLTGGWTAVGQAMQYGAQLAVSDYASQLASAGVSVTLSPQDDQGNASTAVTVANAIVGDTSVLGVVGHLNSGCSVPASKVYHTADLAMVTPMSAAPVLTEQGLNNVFRTCGMDTGQGTLGADVAVKNLRLKRAYVVDDSSALGRTQLANGFVTRFAANGGKVVGRAHTSSRQTDFRKVAAKIKAAKPTVVYYGGTDTAGANLLKRLRRIGVKCQFMGGSSLYDSAFVSIAGGSAEAVVVTSVGQPNDQLSGGVAYESRFASAFPGVASIDGDDAYAYDATVAIIKSIIGVAHDYGVGALSGSAARGLVRARLTLTDFYGATGRVRFGSAGDRVSPQFSAWRVKSGAWLETAIIGAPEVSKSYESRHVDVLGSLSPRLSTSTSTVKLLFYRKNGHGKFVLAKTVTASVADILNTSRCTYEAFNVKLSKGSYYVFARQSGDGLATMDSPTKYFAVK